MTILEGAEQEMMRLWGLVAELSEQLSQNRSLSVSLYGQVGNVKNQAIHSQTGFVLRRFNQHLSQEDYDVELERMTASLSSENLALQHDNRQLNTLLKEYEQTLETLMSAFRTRAGDVQERELKLIREYEAKLLLREEGKVTHELASSTAVSSSLARISHLLRQLLRSLGGEDAGNELEEAEGAEYALEREIELARLEAENGMLRRMLDQDRRWEHLR